MKRTITMWGLTRGKRTRLSPNCYCRPMPILWRSRLRASSWAGSGERPVKVTVTLEWEP